MIFLFHNPPMWLLAAILMIPLSVLLALRGIYILIKRHFRPLEKKLAIGSLLLTVIIAASVVLLPIGSNPSIALTFPFGIIVFLFMPLFGIEENSFLTLLTIHTGCFLNFSSFLAIAQLLQSFAKRIS